jgi:hypothetical protein
MENVQSVALKAAGLLAWAAIVPHRWQSEKVCFAKWLPGAAHPEQLAAGPDALAAHQISFYCELSRL